MGKAEQEICAVSTCDSKDPSHYWPSTDKWYCVKCAHKIQEALLGKGSSNLFYWRKFDQNKPYSFDYEQFDACD